MPISNSYQAYNADGTTESAGSFAYWTDPVFDTASTPNPGHDTNPTIYARGSTHAQVLRADAFRQPHYCRQPSPQR